MQEGLPPYRCYFESEVDATNRPNGRVYFSVLSTGAQYVTIEYVLVHSAEWFATSNRIQAIALHRTVDEGEPTRANLVAPLYCNIDVPWSPAPNVSVLDCGEWPNVSLPLSGAPTTVANFSSTNSVDPASVAYQSLNPLTGRLLLTHAEYALLKVRGCGWVFVGVGVRAGRG